MTDNTTLETSTEDVLWPRYTGPEDLAVIEAVPLEARGLPESTYALLVRAATRWPERTAITVLPDAARWREPLRRIYTELLADVHTASVALTAGAEVTEDELVAWPAERVHERAAAPETVTILDSLPVTDVGKPYKLGLRADATRRELLDAFAETTGAAGISAAVEYGAIVATVVLDPGADPAAAEAILSRYAIDARVEVRQ
ncbi:hypothetical protein ABTW96_22265 [Nocardia beijingensis]